MLPHDNISRYDLPPRPKPALTTSILYTQGMLSA